MNTQKGISTIYLATTTYIIDIDVAAFLLIFFQHALIGPSFLGTRVNINCLAIGKKEYTRGTFAR